MEKNVVGVAALGQARVTVHGSAAVGNSEAGFKVFSGLMSISDCVAANNYYGVFARGGSVFISLSTVTNNDVGMMTDAGQIQSMRNNMVTSNYTFNVSGASPVGVFQGQ